MVDAYRSYKPLIFWLLGTCFLLWLMIMLGGATRLTHSGLSIVEWRPISGIIPPLTHHQWVLEFDKYKQFPEYLQVNKDMSLAEFQFIFWMEFAHRFLGRLIGLFFLIPLVIFWIKKQLPDFLKKRSLIALGIGLIQGFMGWYMVKSGLVKDPTVSHYRLTVHLALALILFSFLLWTAFDLSRKPQDSKGSPSSLTSLSISACVLLGITITYGGLVAGLKAGLIYNTFPLMENRWIPAEWLDFSPVHINFLENPATVQLIHRWLALVTFALIVYTAYQGIKRTSSRPLQQSGILWISATGLQVLLGIMTLLHQVPVVLGTLHQGTAVLVLATGLHFLWLTQTLKKQHV